MSRFERLEIGRNLTTMLHDPKIEELFKRMSDYMARVLDEAKKIKTLPTWASSYHQTFREYLEEIGAELSEEEFLTLIIEVWGKHFGLTTGNDVLIKRPTISES